MVLARTDEKIVVLDWAYKHLQVTLLFEMQKRNPIEYNQVEKE